MNVIVVGSGPTVVLGSSFLWTAEMWAPRIEALSNRYRLVIPELWGHGGSGAMPPGTTDMRGLARQHLRLLDQLGIESCAIVGLSVGGMWGAELAFMAPERVSSIILMDTSLAAEPRETRDQYLTMLDAIHTHGAVPDALREAVVPLFFSPSVRSRQPDLPQAFDANLRSWNPERLRDSVVPLGRIIFDRRDALQDAARLSIPALVMTGADDMARSLAEGRAMAERIGCEFATIPDAGHIASLEAPKFVNEAVASFLDTHALS